MIADQLGHSRVSMTQDVYLGRRSRESRVAAALEGVDPMASGESVGESGAADGRVGVRRNLPWSGSWRGDSNP
jgi:hypothetical protein